MYKMFTRMMVLFLALTVIATPVFSATLPALPSSNEPAPATVKAAVDEFNNLSKKEKKQRVKEVKKAIKQYKADKRAGKQAETSTLLLVIIAILLPPLAVYLYEGTINNRFWISLILTILGWLPGVIYALVLILGNK